VGLISLRTPVTGGIRRESKRPDRNTPRLHGT
jgi:hypothetical protein